MAYYKDNPWSGLKFDSNSSELKSSIFDIKLNNVKKNNNKFLKIFLIIFLIWIISGFYMLNNGENAVELVLGKFHSVKSGMINYCLPFPFCGIYKVNVEKVNEEKFIIKENESILTSDDSLINFEYIIKWKVNDVKEFLFSLQNVKQTIIDVSGNSVRKVLIDKNNSFKNLNEVERKLEDIIQNKTDSYKSGVKIVEVEIKNVNVPKELKEVFDEFNKIDEEKEKNINDIKLNKDNILLKAKNEADKIIYDAELYKENKILNAKIESEKFLKLYQEYKKNKKLVKEKMILDTFNDIIKSIDKVVIENVNNN